jgi:uncharacterized protein (DUF924 family)
MKRFSPTSTIEPEQVLDYWFAGCATNPDRVRQQKRLWYRSKPDTDAEITKQFGNLLKEAALGKFDNWAGEPRSALALVIVLDQFSRHIHRGAASAFRQDPRALEITDVFTDEFTGEFTDDHSLTLIEQAFLFHPYKHAESQKAQARSVSLYDELVKKSDEHWQPLMEDFYMSACLHQKIVDRFGRFPHRNELLGRISTDQEVEYLASHPAAFGQRKRPE